MSGKENTLERWQASRDADIPLVYQINEGGRRLLKRPENLTDRQTTSQAVFAELGMNGKAKLAMKKACGLKSLSMAEVGLLHTPGKLPTPEVAHRFRVRGKFTGDEGAVGREL